MSNVSFPDINWPTFAYCNENQTEAFEDMTRRLFTEHFLKGVQLPHSDHNTPGVEVAPILEPCRNETLPQKRISFQSKYFEQESVGYNQIKKSAQMAVKHYKGELDLIYLFCNKTISITSESYKAVERILAEANIELSPISNKELLDLIAKYPDIYNYFFRPRDKGNALLFLSSLADLQINGIANQLSMAPTSTIPQSMDKDLLNKLIAERVNTCYSLALDLEIEALNAELDKLFEYGIYDADGADTLYFYKFLVLLHSNKDYSDISGKCGDKYKEEIEWLVDFFLSPSEISACEFRKHVPVVQVFILDKLFTSLFWNNVVDLCTEIRNEVDPEMYTMLDLHHALALFNLQQYDLSSDLLHTLAEKTHIPRIQMYSVFADIRKANIACQNGNDCDHEQLSELLTHLDSFKELKQYQKEESLVAVLKLEAFYRLGFFDKKYLDRAIAEYACYSEETKQKPFVVFFYALCLEQNGDKVAAAELYSSLPWKEEASIAERYMICLILSNDSEKAIDIYNALSNSAKNSRTTAIYLLALDRSKNELYEKELTKSVSTYSKSLFDISQIAYHVESKEAARSIVAPYVKKLISEDNLQHLEISIKAELLTFLANIGEIELIETVLKSIADISKINRYVINEIYKAVFVVANREYARQKEKCPTATDFESAENIADIFLEKEIAKDLFLHIKVLCCGAKHMSFSMLHYSKELFEITHDTATARNIVALLHQRKESKMEEYAPYLNVLQASETPDCCMAIAAAMTSLGQISSADYYTYKALYLLNGHDDFSIYKQCFGYFNQRLKCFTDETKLHLVKGNVVIMLEEVCADEKAHILEFCLDSESDFSDPANRSLNVEHLYPANHEYIKLYGSSLMQTVKLRGKEYRITQIMPREEYAAAYIFRKVHQNPKMFEGSIWTISTENIEEMLAQMKMLTDNSNQLKSLLRSYNFENNRMGLPIEAIAFCDYSRYIGAFKYLLYQPNEAFYAGESLYEDESNQQYVPTLSTLVLLSIMDKLDILALIKDRILIPDSYRIFFREQYAESLRVVQTTSATLCFVDDRPVIQDADQSIPDIWERIVEFCEKCNSKSISDDERIAFQFVEGLTGERLISSFELHPIHLDALILASKEKATYLCDDLFFRKIADSAGVRHLNFVSLLQHFEDIDRVASVIMELSKTNYIYIPLIARSDDEMTELCKNILTGEKKQKFYSAELRKYYKIQEAALRELFGDEYVDTLKSELLKQHDQQINN